MTTTTMDQAAGGAQVHNHGMTGKAITNYKGRTRRIADTV